MSDASAKRAIIIGAGPAGLTAAFELLTRTKIKPIVLEKSTCMGGISRTVNYKGNRIDIGGHRFFSKSDRVMEWWLKMLPLEAATNGAAAIQYHRMERTVQTSASDPAPANPDSVMLLRGRKSRIYYLRRFFDYPISLSKDTLLKLGVWRTFKIGVSYMQSAMFPLKNEQTLEQFFINRFGRELYGTFFKSYTEKVWGVPCDKISAEWGAQRIKGLSVWSTLMHAAKKLFKPKSGDIAQKGTETSLIEQFMYPKFGPGQMWDEVARRVKEMGGEIHTGCKAERLITDGWRVKALETSLGTFEGDYFFSTAPVQEIMRAFDVPPPKNVLEVSDGLVYRDFMTVGLLLRSLKIHDETPQGKQLIRDNWIYIQEPDVMLGRLQIFNNWSPFMVADAANVWLGLEYFCNDIDEIWKLSDERMVALATEELSKIGIIDAGEVLDATVLRMEKTYPAYFGTYDRFAEIRAHVDRYENLFLVGRNGMHRYNNQDHSMLTAMMAVDDIISGKTDKTGLWEVNTEMDYHEEKGNPRDGSGMIENAAARRIWIAGMCLLCGLLITVQAWAGRYSMDPDGVSYLDMADKLQHADFSPLLHPYWSPLYPALLAFALKLFPTAAMEFPAVHLANCLIGLMALAAFTFFILQSLRTRTAGIDAESIASFRCRTGLAYVLFLLGTLEAIGVASVAPDLCVAALVYLAAGLCCRLAGGSGSYVTSGLLGVTLGFAYLAKAAMMPLSAILLLLLAIRWFSREARRSLIAVAIFCFLAILGPYVFALSRSQHHLTFGESGSLNYAWSVEGGIPVFAGWMTASPTMGTPAHPPRLLNTDPPVLEFKDTVPATFPLWYNPVYFHQGLQLRVSLRKEFPALARSLRGFRWTFGYGLYPLLAGLVLLVSVAPFRRVLINLSTSLLLFWSLAAFGMYALVVVLPRYIAPFMVLFWFAIYEAFPSGGLKSVIRGTVGAVSFCILLFHMLVLYKTRIVTPGIRSDAHLVVARELEHLGLRAGDEIATIGSGFDAYYAQLARLRIVATIGYNGGPSDDENLAPLNDRDLSLIEGKASPA